MNRGILAAVLCGVIVGPSAGVFAADAVQGLLTADGLTGKTATPHGWREQNIYVGQLTSGYGAAGTTWYDPPGWYSVPKFSPPGGFPGGTYALFCMSYDGHVPFAYRTNLVIPDGPGNLENQMLNTPAHYSVMYNVIYTEWGAAPWIWGTDFYQTFVATTPHITRLATQLAGKSGDHLPMTLNFGVYETNGGPPSTWTQIGGTRGVYLSGGTDPIIHIFWVPYRSNEMQLVPGNTYAARFWRDPSSQSDSFAIVARTDTAGNGYTGGHLYSGDSPQTGLDAFGFISGGAEGTVVNTAPVPDVQETTLSGWSDRFGQTFVASGTGVAAAEITYTTGDPTPPVHLVSFQVYAGVGGNPIGPAKTCYGLPGHYEGRVAVFWDQGDVPTIPGQTYYIEWTLPASGANSWFMVNNVPGEAYVGGVSQAPKDMLMSIAEYFQPDPVIALSTGALNLQVPLGVNLPSGAFTVRNSGGETLNYTINDDMAWLSVSPPSGSSIGELDTIDVLYSTASLGLGTYTGAITVSDGAALNSPQTVDVTLKVTPRTGDFDNDLDADQGDFGFLQSCMSEEGGSVDPECEDADLDRDGWVGPHDYAIFAACVSGPQIESDPYCLDLPPVVVAAVSRQTHGGAGTFDINLLTPGSVECRQPGLTDVIVTFDQNVEPADGTLDLGAEVDITVNGTIQNNLVSSLQVVGSVLTIGFTGVPDEACVTTSISGLISSVALTPVNDPTDVVAITLVGDVTGNGVVDSNDQNAFPQTLPAATDGTNFRADVNVNGTVNLVGDMAIVQARNGNTASCPGYPQPLIQLSTSVLSPSVGEGGNAPQGTFTVLNAGEAVLNYTITEDIAWLSLSPESGSSTDEADTITVTYSTAALSADVYNGTITVEDPAAPNSPQSINVSLSVTAQPQIFGAVSRRTHGGAGTFDINLLAANPVECRTSGVTQAVITFDQDVVAEDGTLNTGDEVGIEVNGAPNNGLITSLQIAGAVLTVNLSGVPDEVCLTITLRDIGWVSNPSATIPETDLDVAILAGDPTGDGVVNSTDQNTFPGSLPTPANAGNFRYDVNADGTITFLGDRQIVVANTGHTASCP